jgi:hypothetical protein
VWRWTGLIVDQTWQLIGLYLARRIPLISIIESADNAWQKYVAEQAKSEAARPAAERLGNLMGKSRTEARGLLEKAGFKRMPNTRGGYERWYHSDGSRVHIRPNGGVVRTGPKVTPTGGGKQYRPRIGPDGKRTDSHNTGEKVSDQ